jgi:hypothetical protein
LQLAPAETWIIAGLAKFPLLPAINVIGIDALGTRTEWVRDISEFWDFLPGPESPGRSAVYTVNLRRLGIIEITRHSGPFTEPDYQRVIGHPQVEQLRAALDANERDRGGAPLSWTYDRHQLVVTEFGRRFIDAVIDNDP